jgi:hypothetical protein
LVKLTFDPSQTNSDQLHFFRKPMSRRTTPSTASSSFPSLLRLIGHFVVELVRGYWRHRKFDRAQEPKRDMANPENYSISI